MKYRPDYPNILTQKTKLWPGPERSFLGFDVSSAERYNNDHHHVALGLLTPAMVHFGQAPAVLTQRQATLDQAYALHPERFVHGAPAAPVLPPTVWINPSAAQAEQDTVVASSHDEALDVRGLALTHPSPDAESRLPLASKLKR